MKRDRNLARVLPLAAALLGLPSQLSAAEMQVQDTLLLGLRGPDGSLGAWIVDSTGLHGAGTGVVSPRGDSLWRMDTAVLLPPVGGAVDEEEEPVPELITLQAWPVGAPRPPTPAMSNGDQGFYNRASAELLFVGPDKVSVRSSGSGTGGYPIAWDRLRVRPLQAVIPLGMADPQALAIGEVLGEDVEAGLVDRGPSGCATPSPDNWGLVRAEGRWIVRGGHTPMASFCPAELAPFGIPAPAPAELVGAPGRAVDWRALAAAHEGLVDALSSPSGRVDLLVFPDRLAVAVDGRIVAERAGAGQAIVAAQWAPSALASGAWREALSLPILGFEREAAILQLQEGHTDEQDEGRIRDLFLGVSGAELLSLRDSLDGSGTHRGLQHLIFSDLDDSDIREQILAHFAAAAVSDGGVQVVSDIDDTFVCGWVDARYPKGTVYPGVLAFYAALNDAPGVTFLSARPGDRLGLVEDATLEMLQERGVARPTLLAGSWTRLTSNEAIAEAKMENLASYAHLYPERRFVFVGDSGQGDAAAGLQMRQRYLDRVPAVFIHDLVNTEEGVRRLGRRERARMAAQGVYVFDSYLEAGTIAFAMGLLDASGLAELAARTVQEHAALSFDTSDQARERSLELKRALDALPPELPRPAE